MAVDVNQTLETRKQHVSWGPGDANKDGVVDGDDAAHVLENVRWVRRASDSELVNLNWNTQSYAVWDWWSCIFGGGAWDHGFIHAYEAKEDAQYIGYCVE